MMKVSITRVGDVWEMEASGTPAEVAELIRMVNDYERIDGYVSTDQEPIPIPVVVRKYTGVNEGTYPTAADKRV
ncbi:hypothetical protein [Paenibacillus pinihumi]|uniref:hypothetical protein n=1 Tax=Paenibacillus pinihumi TaxID=669462 RepID=UPI0004914EE7|nr:hypothetical protein [Paenibacillus pinihumi]